MIRVTKLNGGSLYVNAFEVEFIEETPDTVITLKSGKKILVEEDADTVIDRMISFYRRAIMVLRPFDEQKDRRSKPMLGDDPYI